MGRKGEKSEERKGQGGEEKGQKQEERERRGEGRGERREERTERRREQTEVGRREEWGREIDGFVSPVFKLRMSWTCNLKVRIFKTSALSFHVEDTWNRVY